MNVLKAREKRVQQNDQLISEMKKAIHRRLRTDRAAKPGDYPEVRALKEDVAFEARVEWDRQSREGLELSCECGGPSCSLKIHPTGTDVKSVRLVPESFLCARDHDVIGIDVASEPLRGESEPRPDFVVAWPREDWDAPVSKETMKNELEVLEEAAATNREEMNSALGRLAAALTSGTVVLGLFTTLRPNLKELATVLVLLVLVPFLGLVVSSILMPLKIRRDFTREQYPGRYGEGWRKLEERERRRYNHFVKRPESEVYERNPAGVTYESFYRRRAAIEANPLMFRALLPPEDWLVSRLNDMTWIRSQPLDYLDRIRGQERLAAFWLTILVAYLVGLTAFA